MQEKSNKTTLLIFTDNLSDKIHFGTYNWNNSYVYECEFSELLEVNLENNLCEDKTMSESYSTFETMEIVRQAWDRLECDVLAQYSFVNKIDVDLHRLIIDQHPEFFV